MLLLSGAFFITGLNIGSESSELAFTTNPIGTATAWEPYSYQAVASKSVSWSLTSNQYGINISSSGYVYGLFTKIGNASISIKAVGDAGMPIFQNFTISIISNPRGVPEFAFAAASDGHLACPGNPYGNMQTALTESVKAQSLDTIFDLGDLANGNTGIAATVANYSIIKGIYDDSELHYYVAMGNHDDVGAFSEVFPGSLDYYVIKDNIIMIVLNASTWPVTNLNDTQIAFLNDTLNSHKGSLAFVMCHEGRKQLNWPDSDSNGEANDIRFQQIIESNYYHMGGVLVGHSHCAGSIAGNKTFYTYTGTYGSTYQNGFNTPMGYGTIAIFKNLSSSGYSVRAWYEVLGTNSPLPSTYLEYDVPGPLNQT